jgi:hypothetical protein
LSRTLRSLFAAGTGEPCYQQTQHSYHQYRPVAETYKRCRPLHRDNLTTHHGLLELGTAGNNVAAVINDRRDTGIGGSQ